MFDMLLRIPAVNFAYNHPFQAAIYAAIIIIALVSIYDILMEKCPICKKMFVALWKAIKYIIGLVWKLLKNGVNVLIGNEKLG
jgi:phage-related protein